jgi:excisionase family DNA binding protein
MSSAVAPEPATISVPEAGRILGVSRKTAYVAAANGDIPTIRIGGRILVPTQRLAALLAGEPREGRLVD